MFSRKEVKVLEVTGIERCNAMINFFGHFEPHKPPLCIPSFLKVEQINPLIRQPRSQGNEVDYTYSNIKFSNLQRFEFISLT